MNFACSDWLVAGGAAEERYRGFGRESVFRYPIVTHTCIDTLTILVLIYAPTIHIL